MGKWGARRAWRRIFASSNTAPANKVDGYFGFALPSYTLLEQPLSLIISRSWMCLCCTAERHKLIYLKESLFNDVSPLSWPFSWRGVDLGVIPFSRRGHGLIRMHGWYLSSSIGKSNSIWNYPSTFWLTLLKYIGRMQLLDWKSLLHLGSDNQWFLRLSINNWPDHPGRDGAGIGQRYSRIAPARRSRSSEKFYWKRVIDWSKISWKFSTNTYEGNASFTS